MLSETLSTSHLDYLQRSTLSPAPLEPQMPLTSAPPALRRLLRVKGIGRLRKAEEENPKQSMRLVSEDLLAGLYGYKIPLAFLIRGEPGSVAVHLGTWSPVGENASATVLGDRQDVLSTVLHGLYPVIELEPAEVLIPGWPLSGLVLGIPDAKVPNSLDAALPIDRLIRALSGTNWDCLLLAQPIDEGATIDLRRSVINEMRSVDAETRPTGGPSPLAQHYLQQLKAILTALTQGQAVGAWRTGLYLLGDSTSYYRLSSVWRATFSGKDSRPEPVRVWDTSARGAADLATDWAMPDAAERRGPGHYHHPFQYQTLLSSAQLAAYVHLPSVETGGFTVSAVPDYDAMPALPEGDGAVSLGRVVQYTRPTERTYAISPEALNRHAFVAGVTGSGKSNTIFHLLKQFTALGVPFLVVEPAKTEYRALLDDPDLGTDLQVFTLGSEQVAPFRMNPFEVLPGTPVAVHIDLLRSAFGASFGMWTPLPQVLEQCLHEIYQDRGWDITDNTNARLDSESDVAEAFPTLTDLLHKVEEVTWGLGYDKEVTSNIDAALRTRVNGLRAGGKGRMLDVQRSLPMDKLLERPTVLELEGMGDDDDKAFVMGLFFVRLVEHRRAAGQADGLRHLLVVEEAHRLLSNVERGNDLEEGDPRGKAVETFTNLLSEIRAYGQGVIVADQVPVKLAPDVIKNTNLKIAHRVVDKVDREVLAGAMAMTESQTKSLGVLTRGQAAVFSEGDDSPLLVQVPKAKGQPGKSLPDNGRVAERMADWRARYGLQSLLWSCASPAGTCQEGTEECEAALEIVEDAQFQNTFSRIVLSTIEDTGALDRVWGDLISLVNAERPAKLNQEELLECLSIHASRWFADRRGSQAGWTYAETAQLADKLCRMLRSRAEELDVEGEAEGSSQRTDFQQHALALHTMDYAPFLACSHLCQQRQPPACPSRYAVADLIARGDFWDAWHQASVMDSNSQNHRRTNGWQVCLDATDQLIEMGAAEEARRHVALCFAQQMLSADSTKLPETKRMIIDKLMSEATHD